MLKSISRKFADPKGKALRACKETGNAEKLLKALSQLKGNNDIIILDDGFTALHLCCIHGHIECVRALVDNNYDINASHSFTGVTPLHLACQKGFLDILKFLLASKKCDIQKVCKHGNNCLHYAVEANHKEIAAYLIKNGASIKQKSTAGRNPIIQAAKARADGCLVLLLEKVINDKDTALLNESDNDGNTILHYACVSMNKDIVQYLVDYGADMNIKNKDGNQPVDLCKGQIMKDIKDVLENHSKRMEHALTSLSLSTNILSIDEILSPSKDNSDNTNYAELEVDLDINNVSLNFDLSINANSPQPHLLSPPSSSSSSSSSSNAIAKQASGNPVWMNLMAATCRLYGRKRFESKFKAFLLWKKLTDTMLRTNVEDNNQLNKLDADADNDNDDISGQVDNSLNVIFTKIQTQHRREYLDVLRDFWTRLASFEPDMKSFGCMPVQIKPIIKSNENSLWLLYCNYCSNQRDLPSKSVPASVRYHKKLLESDRIWVLLRDFGICPDVCRKTLLYDLVAEVLLEEVDPTNNNQSSSAEMKIKSPTPRTKPTASLSFDNFLKLLWKIASTCLEMPLSSPSKRIIFLLTKMDSSNGRARMLQLFRNAKNIPSFNLIKSNYNGPTIHSVATP